MSGAPRRGWPWNQRRRRNTGWPRRSEISRRTKSTRSRSAAVPVVPGDLVVLAVGVVVAPLGPPDLVAAEEHRARPGTAGGSARKFRCWRRRQASTAGVVGRPLDPAVPRAVVALAVPVLLAVRLVVLLVVRDEVGQGEAVVRGDEVDAGHRAAGVGLVEVGAAGEPGGQLGQGRRLPPPEVAHGVAVLAVPLRPHGREVADLVAALAEVPGLGDQLDLADDGVLLDQVEEGRQPVDLVELAGQRGGQVEAEAVDVHLGHPVAERVHDQLERCAGGRR